MRLLDVGAVLDREKDIRRVGSKIEVLKELDDKSTSYVILSHRWGNEVTYDEMTGLTMMKPRKRGDVRERDGYQKIIKSCEQARKDSYRWLWVDTCCIDKRSSSELSEAINSMYRWYRNSQMCYVYLHDVIEQAFPTEQDFGRFSKSNGWPEWFSRGWTLQELIAPEKVTFFNKDWLAIGTKKELKSTLNNITRIPKEVLINERVLRSIRPFERPCVAHIVSWAAGRKTTREEDRAYSLLGLFGVNLPMLYGEGSKAFQRLQLEIIRFSSDHSIFAWNPKGQLGGYGSVLAEDPSCFRGCHDIVNMDRGEFVKAVEDYVYARGLAVTGDQSKLVSFSKSVDSTQLLRWDITNLGIHLSLPVLPSRDRGSFHKAILPCRGRYGNLITIDLESCGPRFRCTYPGFDHSPVYACPEFRSLYLDCSQQYEGSSHKLWIGDGDTSSHGFTRCGTFPHEFAGDTVAFSSQGHTLVVLVYANDDAKSRFAVGLGHYLGQACRQVVCDEYSAHSQQGARSSWADFAKQVYDIMWNAPISRFPDTTESIHLPRSVYHARVFSSGSRVEISVEQCPGCCGGQGRPVGISSADELYTPLIRGSYQLDLGRQSARLVECFGHEIKLGDYGDFFGGIFTCRGNIFELIQQLRIAHPVYSPVISPVFDCLRIPRRVQTRNLIGYVSSFYENQMVLHQSRSFSLPDNENFGLLLRALSTRFAGYSLATTVVECSEFYKADNNGKRMGAESAPEGGNGSADPGTFTPLCSIAVPRPWGLHRVRRQQFKRIREHFYAMAELRDFVGTEARHESADRRTSSDMVNLLVMFGLDYLQELVGEITFFERLPSIMQAWRRREPSVGAVDVVRLSDLLSVSSVVIQDLLTSLAFHLSRKSPRYETRTAHSVSSHEQDPKPLLIRKPRGHHAIEFLSDTLSAGLLEHICDTLDNVMDFDESRRRDHRGHTDFDMDRTHFTIKEVEALQVQLQATEDDGEQRALEEDLTGQILWFYRCGILSEVDHILARVVYYIQDNRYTSNEYDYRGLFKTTEIIKRTSHVGTDDDIAHLRRIMFDAGAGVSRHKLWLAARAAGRTGDVMEVYTEMSPAGSSTTDSPSAGLENDTTGIAEAGNYTDTPSFERPDHRTMPIRVARDNVLPQ